MASAVLTRGPSLAKLLGERLGVRTKAMIRPLTVENILKWAKAHQRRTGKRPNGNSGSVLDAPGETWTAVGVALEQGLRGLPGGDTLFRLLWRGRPENGKTESAQTTPKKRRTKE